MHKLKIKKEMKKYILFVIAVLVMPLLSSCGEDDEPESPSFTSAESDINSYLQGEWEGTKYSMDIPYETNHYSFSPRTTPENIILTLTGVVNIEHEYKIIGDAHLVIGFGRDNNIIDTEGDDYCYCYDEQNSTITFLYSVDGTVIRTKEDKYYFERISNTSFKMRAYGLADNEANWITYNKK